MLVSFWGLSESTCVRLLYGKIVPGVDAAYGKQWIINRDAKSCEYGNPVYNAANINLKYCPSH